MKNRIVFTILLAAGMAAAAQTAKVQSAISDLRNQRLGKAKVNIEAACSNEKTSNDAKTWYYAGSIYCNLIDMSSKDPQKYKKQKISEPITDLIKLAKTAIEKSMELEKAANTYEYAQSNVQNLKFLGGSLFNASISFVEKNNWVEAIGYLESSVEIAGLAGDKNLQQQAQFLLAQCYMQNKDNDKAKDAYRDLVKGNTKEPSAYINLYAMHIAAKDTAKALNVMKRGAKNLPQDFKILTVYAAAQLQSGDLQGAFESLNKAIQIDPKNHQIRNAAGNVLRDARNYDKALVEYQESLKLNAEQYDANYGLGSVYYNNAIDLSETANNLPMDQTVKYEELNNKAKELFGKAIPYFEDALKYKVNDYYTLIGLRNIYAKLGNTEKYQETNAIIESLK